MKDLVSEGFANVVKPYIDNEIATRAKLGAHNLLPNTVQNETVHGITFAVNPDGSINVSGTATSDITYYTSPFIILPDGEYILNGCPNGGSSSTYRLTMTSNNMNVSKGNDVGEGIRFSFNKTNDVNLRPYILIKSGVTIDAIFKPMVRLASDANSAYQPYAMTNRELTEKLVLNNVTITPETGVTIDYNGSHKIGNLVILNFRFLLDASFSVAEDAPIATIDTPPLDNVILSSVNAAWDGALGGIISILKSTNIIKLSAVGNFVAGKSYVVNLTYVCA